MRVLCLDGAGLGGPYVCLWMNELYGCTEVARERCPDRDVCPGRPGASTTDMKSTRIKN